MNYNRSRGNKGGHRGWDFCAFVETFMFHRDFLFVLFLFLAFFYYIGDGAKENEHILSCMFKEHY